MIDSNALGGEPEDDTVSKLQEELEKPPYLLLQPCRSRILTGLGMLGAVMILIYLLSG
tara:strand:+ start:951 stop:1124 length:174 start_codon:yes stop_codon:yes gene_type:complete